MESSSYSETGGGETTTDKELDTSTETDTVTDTDADAPTNTEESSESSGPAGIILERIQHGHGHDTSTLGNSYASADADSDTETVSTEEDDNTYFAIEYDTVAATASQSGSSTAPDTLTEVESQIFGTAGIVTGGADESVETSSDTDSASTSETGQNTATYYSDDDETDADDSSWNSDTHKESGLYNSTSTDSDDASSYESYTDTLGDGGAIIGGALTQDMSGSSGFTQTVTETDGDSDSYYACFHESGEDWDATVGTDQGSDTTTEDDSAPSTMTETLSEAIGADGTVASGDESDSLSEASDQTTTETGSPTDTVTESLSEITMTLTETNASTATANESDEDWATETLGAVAATIAGGSDCFTVGTENTSSYTSTGSGPESYSDTATTLSGDATVDTSGSSSSLDDQIFGDVLGSGGGITSGSLTYTVSSSDSSADSTTESGSVTATVGEGILETYSYGSDVTQPSDDTAYETGTETLGAGGTIDGGIASFTWSDGSAINRDLTDSGDVGVTGNESDSSTDTYGFAESGTETITTGGADAPSTVSFVWNQMGTDNYVDSYVTASPFTIGTMSGSTSDNEYMTDTVSSSWHDAGVDALTDGDSVTAESNTYTWNNSHSFAGDVTTWYQETIVSYPAYTTVESDLYSESGVLSFTSAETGCDTLSADGDELTIDGNTASFSVGGFVTQSYDDNFSDSLTTGIFGEGDFQESSILSTDGYGSIGIAQSDTASTSGTVTTGSSDSQSLDEYLSSDEQWSLATAGETSTTVHVGSDSSLGSMDSYSTELFGTPSYQITSSYSDYADSDYSDSAFETGTFSVTVPYYFTYTWNTYTFGVENTLECSTLYSDDGTHTQQENGDYDLSDMEITQDNQLNLETGSEAQLSGTGYATWGFLSTVSEGEPLTVVEIGSSGSGTSWTTTGEEPTTTSDSYGDELYPIYLQALSYGPSVPGPTGGFPSLLGDLQYLLSDFQNGSAAATVIAPNTANGPEPPGVELVGADSAEGISGIDGVSREAQPSPTTTLVALAAAGRNPADITLPTVGSESSGDDGDVIVLGAAPASSPSGASQSVSTTTGSTSGSASGSSGSNAAGGAGATSVSATTTDGMASVQSDAGIAVQPDDDGGAPGSHEVPSHVPTGANSAVQAPTYNDEWTDWINPFSYWDAFRAGYAANAAKVGAMLGAMQYSNGGIDKEHAILDQNQTAANLADPNSQTPATEITVGDATQKRRASINQEMNGRRPVGPNLRRGSSGDR